MDAETFGTGLTWQDYLASMTANHTLLQRKVAAFRFGDYKPETFAKTAIRTVLVFTEDWCQDSISALPPLVAVAKVAALAVRVFRRSEAWALHCALLRMEYPPIPTFLFYDDSWCEVGRLVEMPIGFRILLNDPSEAMWVKEMYDELWWQLELEDFARFWT